MSGFSPADIPDLAGRTVIVTGANSGIGLETAKALTAHGARVVLAVRDEARGRAAASALPGPGPAEVRRLDLGSLDSVRAFARDWSGPVHLLINNAGVMIPPLLRFAMEQVGNRVIAQDAAGGALPTLYAATQDLPGNTFVGPSGLFGTRGAPAPCRRSQAASDQETARRLWDVSEQLTGVTFPEIQKQ